MNFTPASLKTQRRKDLKTKKKILHPASFLCVFASLREKTSNQRITVCLSSLDALITAETQKLEAFNTHKRGLMQQLFLTLKEQCS